MKTKLFLIISLIILWSVILSAQTSEKRFAFEINGGASFPLSELAGQDLSGGFGFEGLLHYRLMPHLGAYVGWGWNKLSAEESFAGNDVNVEETGYVFGLQFGHPIGNSSFAYFLRGGGIYNHLETENENGDIINDTGHGLGYQLAGGISYNVGNNWKISPGIKFNSLSRDAEYEGATYDLDYKYISARIGFTKVF